MTNKELIEQIADIVEEILLQRNQAQNSKSHTKCKKVLVISCNTSRGYWAFKKNEAIVNMIDLHFSFDEHQVNPEQFDEVLVCDLDTGYLSQLIEGKFNSFYLKLIAKSIMLGKHVTVISDDLDTVKYKNTAPKKMLSMLEKKLTVLKEWGVQVESQKECFHRMGKKVEKGSGHFIDKKIVTKKDIEHARQQGYNTISLNKKTQLSDIALEYMNKHQMILNRL